MLTERKIEVDPTLIVRNYLKQSAWSEAAVILALPVQNFCRSWVKWAVFHSRLFQMVFHRPRSGCKNDPTTQSEASTQVESLYLCARTDWEWQHDSHCICTGKILRRMSTVSKYCADGRENGKTIFFLALRHGQDNPVCQTTRTLQRTSAVVKSSPHYHGITKC